MGGGADVAALDFLVRKADLKEARTVVGEITAPGEGEVLMEVERFALTANNITYAVFGDAMQYWQFFPAADAADGRIPVWGFGRVLASRRDGVAAGERFYGYFPMSSHLVVRPERVTPAGFADGAAHRKPLHPVYNHYVNVAADPGYRREHAAQQMLLRPLFTTSFLIDDFLADNDFFGADAVILSSASSKTAWGTAFCLKHHARRARVIGLTSPANMAFVQALGIYDEVLPYAAVADAVVFATGSAVYVDMSGSADVRAAVHHRFVDRLKHSCAVGGTHWENLGGASGLPGPRPTLFFAPAQIKKRNADWGAAELQRRIGEAWLALVGRVGEGWLKVTEARGDAAVAAAYAEMLAGRTPPEAGLILSMNP